MNNNNDTHNPDNHPVWDSFSPNNPVWIENEDGSGQWSDGWNGDTPELDSSDENNYDDENDSWRATEMVWQQSPDETKQLLFGVMEAVENLTFLLDKLEGADSFGEDWTARLDELVLVEGPVQSENC